MRHKQLDLIYQGLVEHIRTHRTITPYPTHSLPGSSILQPRDGSDRKQLLPAACDTAGGFPQRLSVTGTDSEKPVEAVCRRRQVRGNHRCGPSSPRHLEPNTPASPSTFTVDTSGDEHVAAVQLRASTRPFNVVVTPLAACIRAFRTKKNAASEVEGRNCR